VTGWESQELISSWQMHEAMLCLWALPAGWSMLIFNWPSPVSTMVSLHSGWTILQTLNIGLIMMYTSRQPLSVGSWRSHWKVMATHYCCSWWRRQWSDSSEATLMKLCLLAWSYGCLHALLCYTFEVLLRRFLCNFTDTWYLATQVIRWSLGSVNCQQTIQNWLSLINSSKAWKANVQGAGVPNYYYTEYVGLSVLLA
jgi:hypothetical protein